VNLERDDADKDAPLYKAAWEFAYDGMVAVDAHGVIIAANPAAGRVFGYPHETLTGTNLAKLLPQAVRASHLTWLADFVTSGKSRLMAEHRQVKGRHKSGRLLALEVALSPVHYQGQPYVIALIRDIEERQKLEASLERMAFEDPLTGLANRRAFMAALRQALPLARSAGQQVALFYLDLDGFKAINDQYGHKIGDMVLKKASGYLRAALRGSDVLARLGGDEFAAILRGTLTPPLAELIAERLKAQFRQPLLLAGIWHTIEVSLGIALYPLEAQTASQLLKYADRAMYEQKRRHQEARVRGYKKE
jgi:diguanylate cyclase (GGDEF)-like protein/PAS domain S-box-containing protein